VTTHRAARGAVVAKRSGQHHKAVRGGAGKPVRPLPLQPEASQSAKVRERASPSSPLPSPTSGVRLYTPDGARKYITAGERTAFLREAERTDRQVRTLCLTLAYAGCRLSEALALTADRIDLAAGVLVIESLKKRRTGIYRAVPVPPALLDALDLVHGIRELQARRGKGRGERLWPWSRMTGWRAVHAVMDAAGLDGPKASPKGLRHGFGVAAVAAGIPLNLVQKWLGHAQLSTTAIYADATGAEEKDIARRMWAIST
jgi:integrase